MNFKSFRAAWNRFFFQPQSPVPVALFRIFYGLMVIATLLLLRPDWIAWYGPNSWVRYSTIRSIELGPRINLFALMPSSTAWTEALFWFFFAAAICLVFGFLTRINTVFVFVCLSSIQQRNLFILHGGDVFLRVAGLFLIFAPAGAAISIDRLIRIWRGKEGTEIRPRAPWAQRMIQFELSVLYFASFCWKIEGTAWIQGTALYYVYHLDELQRFPIPQFLMHPWVLRIATWLALVLEFALGILIWVKELRYPLLAIGVLFHLSLEYSINVPLFQWDVMSAYVLFIDPADLQRFWRWLTTRAAKYLGPPRSVTYDGSSARATRKANLLRSLDIFHRLNITDARN